MIQDTAGSIEYDERGSGPTIVLVPGSCSTGAAWRPVVNALGDGFRCVTTSLLGYGGTAERRTDRDVSIALEADIVEAVVRTAGGPVHIVGHSFGGLVGAAVALRARVPVASLAVLEAPAVMLLEGQPAEARHLQDFRDMADRYFPAFAAGDVEAIRIMIDFYGGAGTFDSWPARVRAYAMETTAINIREWSTAFAFPLSAEILAPMELPCLVAWGGDSHPAARRANDLLANALRAKRAIAIPGATHFMIASHPADVAEAIAQLVTEAETGAT